MQVDYYAAFVTVAAQAMTIEVNGQPLVAAVAYDGNGIYTEFYVPFTPHRAYVNGKKNTEWTAIESRLLFNVAPLGRILITAADFPVVDGEGSVSVNVHNSIGVQVTDPNVQYVPLVLPGNVAHELSIRTARQLENVSGPVVVIADNGTLSTDWAGIVTERGFELREN